MIALAGSLGFAQSASSQYPLTVSIERSRVDTQRPSVNGSSLCRPHLNLAAVIDGRHFELEGSKVRSAVLALGDYKAKLIADEHSKTYLSEAVYELQYPDGSTEKFSVIGESK